MTRIHLWVSGLLMFSSAFATAPASAATVTGSATYRERMALSPGAVFEATLEGGARPGAPAFVIARARRANPGQVPIAFEITYEPRSIDPNRTYSVRASIREGGRIRFTSDRSYPVLTRGHGSEVRILMVRAAGAGESGESPGSGLGNLPATFVGLVPCSDCVGTRYRIDLLPGGAYMQRVTYLRETHDASYYEIGAWSLSGDRRRLTLEPGRGSKSYWGVGARILRQLGARGEPVESRPAYELTRISDADPMVPRVELSGMFRYMADASRFRDCRSGLEWPVSMSADYQTLERAYTSRRSSPGSELLVSLRGRIEERPRMEGRGTEPTLVVEKFLRAKPRERCDGQSPASEVENNRWVPVEIGGQELRAVSAEQREPWIHLDPNAKRVTGSGGCNRISGGYTAGDGTLRFGPLITTKMACVGMETEAAFLRALEATRRYRVRGREVELYDGRGVVVARLEERNLR